MFQGPPQLQITAADRAKQLTIPTLVVQQPTPINSPSMEFPGSPPPHKERPFQPALGRRMLGDMEKPISLDLPAPPPVITVTCMSDSDTESATTKNGTDSSKNGGGMCYLSPFSMCSRADRIASESNLSSSGYSSGPSRCNSNTRLCPLDGEEQPRRASPLIRAPDIREAGSEEETTFSENDDEGFDTETAEAAPPAKRPSTPTLLTKGRGGSDTLEPLKRSPSAESTTAVAAADRHHMHHHHHQLPYITVQQYPSSLHLSTDVLEKSPVSSRSESPLSDKTVFRFSPMFYGRVTDSDSIYDFTSSDCTTKRRTGKKKGRGKRTRHHHHTVGGLPSSPNLAEPAAVSAVLLDVPGRADRNKSRSKPNTRRRSRSQQTIVPSSSSSTDSLNDTKWVV